MNTAIPFKRKKDCLLNNGGMNYGATRADDKNKRRHKGLGLFWTREFKLCSVRVYGLITTALSSACSPGRGALSNQERLHTTVRSDKHLF